MRHAGGSLARRAPQTARLLGIALLLANCVLLAAFDTPFERVLRNETFDVYQRRLPRERHADPVLVVEIDERSLREIGPWPWPRTRVAQLVERLVVARPAAIALDALFVEPDRYAPSALVGMLDLPPAAEGPLSRHLPDSDARLAAAIRGSPVVLGAAGVDTADARPVAAPPLRQYGADPRPFVPHYPALLSSRPEFVAAARAQALLNGEPERGVFRRLPTLATIGDGTLLASLAVETLRIVGGGEPLLVETADDGLRRVGVAGIAIPVDRDGGWWLHFSRRGQRPTLSAADVVRGAFDGEDVAGRIVLVGYTALGLQDIVSTPLGRMPGVELHAEAIENAEAGRLLSRPRWTRWFELGAMAGLSGVAILGASLLGPGRAIALVVVGALAWAATSIGLFVERGLLIDAVNPLAGVGLVLIGVLGSTLAEAQHQRRLLREQLTQSRDAQLRMQAELDTARRIQTGMLPRPDALAGTLGLELAAFCEPAKTVGGDLYDFFLISPRRLFFVIGDVSGKGLPSALLMALAKAQIKSAALRADGNPGAVLTAANEAIAQDNPEYLFLTAVAGCVDLDSGALAYANAGHDSPLFVGRGRVTTAPKAGGPPLCTVDGYVYPTTMLELPRGVALCLYTDGVSEAQDAGGALYGRERLLACLARRATGARAADLIASIERDVRAYAAGAEQADDMTLLVVARL
ncbi:MAG TPA: CHASE2 domain-containing protein [Gammaproteobacteria bacterium]|nr:CHASE2 domain-containing protein [Gammaproteobacteria bacterium]